MHTINTTKLSCSLSIWLLVNIFIVIKKKTRTQKGNWWRWKRSEERSFQIPFDSLECAGVHRWSRFDWLCRPGAHALMVNEITPSAINTSQLNTNRSSVPFKMIFFIQFFPSSSSSSLSVHKNQHKWNCIFFYQTDKKKEWFNTYATLASIRTLWKRECEPHNLPPSHYNQTHRFNQIYFMRREKRRIENKDVKCIYCFGYNWMNVLTNDWANV